MTISDAKIRALPLKERIYKHSLGEGLYVQVWPDGKKYWRLKYRFAGKEKTYSIGVFPDVSATAALKAKELARDMVRVGTDPSMAKQQAAKLKQKSVSKNLFRLALSLEGGLTIETDTKLLTLKSTQTKALRSFLIANPDDD